MYLVNNVLKNYYLAVPLLKYTYCFSGSQKFVNLLCICGDILVNISKYKNGHISLIFQRIKKTKVVLTMSHQNIQDCVNIC